MASYVTSALAKHYHVEPGTPQVEQILPEPGSLHYVSRLATVEIQSVFCLKVRTQEITAHDLQQVQKHIAVDFAARRFPVVRMLQGHFDEAERLLRQHAPTRSLRTLDALQLAVALNLHAQGKLDYFVCADDKLCKVAADEGLNVINP
jgi:predicted nucleic acid-binding protein